MKLAVFLWCLIAAAGCFGQSVEDRVRGFRDAGKYKVEQDRFKGLTTVMTPLEFAVKIGGGKHYAVVTRVVGIFETGNPGRVYLDVFWPSESPELAAAAILLIDGNRLDLAAADADTRISPGYGIGLRGRNVARFRITAELWKQMAAASRVEWQISREEFTLRPITAERIANLIAVAGLDDDLQKSF